MQVSIAFRVSYTVRFPWTKERMCRMFATREAAEEFLAPLAMAARQAQEFHDVPQIDEVGILTSATRRFCLGPDVDAAFLTSVNM